MRITIKLSDGSLLDQTIDKAKVIVGRSSKCDLTVLDEALSRQHCMIEEVQGNYFITDLSTNGVFINGERIPPLKRTSLSTFFQLHLGPFECHILDSKEIPVPEPSIPSTKAEDLLPTKPSRKINHEALKQASIVTPVKKKDDGSRKTIFLTILTIIFLIGIGWFQMKSNEEKNALMDTKIPEKFTEVKNEFFSQAQYQDLNSKTGCEKDTFFFCDDFKLLQNEKDGFVMQKDEAFIFMTAKKIGEEDPLFKDITSSERDIFIALYYFLSSRVAQKLLNKELAQIHLILQTPDTKIETVLLFHVGTFSAGISEFRYTQTQFLSNLSSGQPEKFLADFPKLFKSKQF